MGMVRSKWLGALAIPLMALASCGGSADTTGSKPVPVPIERYDAEFGSALCEAYASCCAQAGLAQNRAQCVEVFAPKISGRDQLDPARYDPALARTCIDRIADFASSCLLEDLAPPAVKDLCAPLFKSATEMSGLTFGAIGEACSGTCTAERLCSPRPQDATTSICSLQEGRRCAADGTCQAAKAAGEACDSLFDCASGRPCSHGICIEPHSTGPCRDHSQCTSTSDCKAGQCVPRRLDTPDFCAGEF